ncbi:MAG: hypothetical protein ACOCUB_01410 [Desulfohalobiaceae bacterium]
MINDHPREIFSALSGDVSIQKEQAMKIDPDQMKQIQEQIQKQQSGQPGQNSGFAKVLEQQLQPDKQALEQTNAPQMDKTSLQTLHTQLKTQGPEQSSNTSEAGPMHKLESLLGQWEIYSQQLQQNKGLRQSYQTLQNINSDLQDLKQSQDSEQQDPELASLLSELEIMAAAEEIKFNRGDYL